MLEFISILAASILFIAYCGILIYIIENWGKIVDMHGAKFKVGDFIRNYKTKEYAEVVSVEWKRYLINYEHGVEFFVRTEDEVFSLKGDDVHQWKVLKDKFEILIARAVLEEK